MPSKLRSETARLNGAKSQGPKTPEGKEKSSQNAVQHGFTSQSVIVLACESQRQFDEIMNEFKEIHQPANAAELDLVEEMVACRWRIRRLWGIETFLMDAEILNQESQFPNDADNRAYMARAFKSLSDDSRSLALAARYQSRLHRTYNQAYAILRELQQTRESKPPVSPLQPADPSGVWPAQPTTYNPPPDLEPADPQPTTHTPPPDLNAAKGTQDSSNQSEINTMQPQPIDRDTTPGIEHPTSDIELGSVQGESERSPLE